MLYEVIGIFDSGIGGLTVVKEIKKQLPGYKLVYFGDTARLPYGTKSMSTVIKYSIENSGFLISRGAKIIVVACNTASALAGETLNRYFPYPIFEVITPAVKRALEVTKNGKIGIIGTPATIKSGVYQKKIGRMLNAPAKGGSASGGNCQLFSRACPLFVPLVEENWINRPETYSIAKYYLNPLKTKKVDTLVLACTHYPLLRKVIHDIMGKEVTLVNPAKEVARELKEFMMKENLAIPRGKSQFFVSDEPYRFEKLSGSFLGESIKVKKITI